jgi:hypothetical protein
MGHAYLGGKICLCPKGVIMEYYRRYRSGILCRVERRIVYARMEE